MSRGRFIAAMSASAGCGVVIGALLSEHTRVVDAVLDLDADWSSLPAVIVGTAIPAVAGVMFAQRIAEKDTERLAVAQLRAAHAVQEEHEARERDEREARRQRWHRILAASEAFLTRVDETTFKREVLDVFIESAPPRDDKELWSAYAAHRDRAASWAERLVDWPRAANSTLPELAAAVRSQVDDGEVEDLLVCAEALELVVAALSVERFWKSANVDAIVEETGVPPDGEGDRPRRPQRDRFGNLIDDDAGDMFPIVSGVTTTVVYLKQIAVRESARAAEVVFNAEVQWGHGTNARFLDATISFASLRDDLDAIGLDRPT